MSKRSLSSSVSCTTGIPVQPETISAISSGVTSSLVWSFFSRQLRFASSILSLSAFSLSRICAARSKFCSLIADSFSFWSCESSSSSPLTSSGGVKFFRRTLDAASSIRSIALSGRNLSAIYLDESFTAASIASSVIFTLW